MSRSGYSDSCENVQLWRQAVERAIHGKRGQQFMQEMLTALDALPQKRLIANSLVQGGEPCALGSVALLKGIDISGLDKNEFGDPQDPEIVGDAFHISRAMAAEIMWQNDEGGGWYRSPETPEARWSRIRAWVVGQLATHTSAGDKP